MKDKINKIINNKYIYVLYSFLISGVLTLLVFLFNKMNGNDFLVMRSDFTDIYSFLVNTIGLLLEGKPVLFDFTIGLGMNNSLALATSLFSPFNILYFIFYKANLDIITLVIIILKVGSIAAAFEYFSIRVLKNEKFFSIIVSVFYSLNAFVILYGTIQTSWLDALIILPLLVIGLIDCIEKNKRVLLIVMYSYLFISQFYMGYIVGIFSFIFVVLYFFLVFKRKKPDVKPIKEYATIISNWILSVLIAIMVSSFVWIPTLFFIAANRVPDSTEILNFDTSLLQIFNSLFWGMCYGIGGKYSNIYCGLPVLVLSVYFIFDKKINKKDKIFSGIMLIILFLSMNSFRLNSIWHAFDQPDDFWYRFSFLVCFVICSMASKEVAVSDGFNSKSLIFIVSGLSLFYLFILHTVSLWEIDGETFIMNTNFGFTINFVLLVAWSLIIFFITRDNIKLKRVLYVLSALIMFFEIIFGSTRQIQFKIEAKPYYEWCDFMTATVNEINTADPGLHRMIMHKNDNQNHYTTDTLFGYYGLCDFGDEEKYSVRHFLSNVGFATSPRVTFETGYNPVNEMLLGVKYGIKAPDTTSEEADNEDIGYDVNDYALNIGYAVDGGTILYEYSGRNVFENMNDIVNTLSGNENDCFVQLTDEDIELLQNGIDVYQLDTGEVLLHRNDESGELIIRAKDKGGDVYIQFQNENPSLYDLDFVYADSENYTYSPIQRLSTSYSAKMNKQEDSYQITVYGSTDDYICDKINIYYLNEDALKSQYELLSKNQLNVTEFSNGNIEGNIHIDNNRLLLTTIPYDPGWSAFVNGKETEIVRLVEGTFMGIYLPGEGDYNVSFKYELPGFKIGIVVSICGIFAFLSVVFEKQLKKNKKEVK